MISAIEEDEALNSAWIEGDLWYGWAYNDELGRFVFDDTGHELITDLWSYLWKWEQK
jgi:hypothetical protein